MRQRSRNSGIRTCRSLGPLLGLPPPLTFPGKRIPEEQERMSSPGPGPLGTERSRAQGSSVRTAARLQWARERADLSLRPPFLGPPFLKMSLGCLLEAGAVHREARRMSKSRENAPRQMLTDSLSFLEGKATSNPFATAQKSPVTKINVSWAP